MKKRNVIMKEIIGLNKSLEMAQKNLKNALNRLCPEGSIIYFHLKYGQKNPSEGTVYGADDGHYAGYVRVKMHEDVRSVHFSQIIVDLLEEVKP